VSVKNWTREQSLVAFSLYWCLPFGRFHSKNPKIIKYAALIRRTPSALAMKLSNIASLDPAFLETGRSGLKAASNMDRALWQEMQQDWPAFVISMAQAEAGFNSSQLDCTHNPKEPMVTSKLSEVQLRVGQGFFRNAVLSAYDFRCCISGLANPRLLVASHIVPWRSNEQNRLNPRNGLALSALHDKAFDLGLITISEDYRVIVSTKYKPKNDAFFDETVLRFDGKPISLPEKFLPEAQFLSFHRAHIFDSYADCE